MPSFEASSRSGQWSLSKSPAAIPRPVMNGERNSSIENRQCSGNPNSAASTRERLQGARGGPGRLRSRRRRGGGAGTAIRSDVSGERARRRERDCHADPLVHRLATTRFLSRADSRADGVITPPPGFDQGRETPALPFERLVADLRTTLGSRSVLDHADGHGTAALQLLARLLERRAVLEPAPHRQLGSAREPSAVVRGRGILQVAAALAVVELAQTDLSAHLQAPRNAALARQFIADRQRLAGVDA